MAFKVTEPVDALMLNKAESVPDKLYVTALPTTSVAVALKTGVLVGVPSTTVTDAEEVIVGATSVTAIVTACVELKVPSEAITLML